MPTPSMFFGLIIRMYYASQEHNPLYIHVYYQDYAATVKISNCEILEGKLSAKQLRLVAAWIEIHREELIAD